MHCERAIPLIPRYVDGELVESQAAPLRQHLLACPACRGQVQDAEALAAWFVDPEPLVGPAQAPEGFAARVTALAVATGSTAEIPRGPRPMAEALAEGSLRQDRERLSGFVLNLTAAAAVLVLSLALGLQQRALPEVERLQADGASLTETLERLDQRKAEELEQEETSPQAADGSQE